MIISHEKKFIFFHVPKTGGSSLTWNLRHTVDSPNKIENPQIKDRWQALLHIDGAQHSSYIDNIALCEKYKSYFKFAFIRNPWDLALSWYLALSRNQPKSISPQNFNKYIFAQHQCYCYNLIKNPLKYFNKREYRSNKQIKRTQSSYISDLQGNIAVDYTAKYENYEYEFKYIMKTLNITNYEEKKMNVANVNRIKYQDYYDVKSRDLIAKVYRADIETFGYMF